MSERRSFDKIIGQELAKRILVRAVREGNPAHAYLFLGLEGTGKLTTALELAKALNCENPHDGHACGECALCHALEHGNMPDVRVWSPEGQNTRIDQMREMRDQAILKPMRGRWKVNIIEQGDTLNEESANCILKLLEEPPDYLINILLYRNAAAMLATIRSRCQLVRFTQVHAEELAARLVEDFDASEEQARFLAAYSQGCPGKAIGLLDDASFAERRDLIIATAKGAISGNPWLALSLAGLIRGTASKSAADDDDTEEAPAEPKGKQPKQAKRSKRDIVTEALDMLVLWYRDLMVAKVQGQDAPLVNVDKRDEVLRQAGHYVDAGQLSDAVEAILESKRAVLGNANPQIVTEALMMRLTA